MSESNEKRYLSDRIINRLCHIIISQYVIGNNVRIISKEINSDKYELKIELIKEINPRSVTFANCGFTNEECSIDFDEDFNVLTEYFKATISEDTLFRFENKLEDEGFEFLIKKEKTNV